MILRTLWQAAVTLSAAAFSAVDKIDREALVNAVRHPVAKNIAVSIEETDKPGRGHRHRRRAGIVRVSRPRPAGLADAVPGQRRGRPRHPQG